MVNTTIKTSIADSMSNALYLLVCVFSHYFVHGGWFPEKNYLLDNVDAIRHIPATIVQGRYDVVTPMKTAWELHKVINVVYVIIHSVNIMW